MKIMIGFTNKKEITNEHIKKVLIIKGYQIKVLINLIAKTFFSNIIIKMESNSTGIFKRVKKKKL